jgi:hypothetical protein
MAKKKPTLLVYKLSESDSWQHLQYVTMAGEPSLILDFGPYGGTPMDDVPLGYMLTLCNKSIVGAKPCDSLISRPKDKYYDYAMQYIEGRCWCCGKPIEEQQQLPSHAEADSQWDMHCLHFDCYKKLKFDQMELIKKRESFIKKKADAAAAAGVIGANKKPNVKGALATRRVALGTVTKADIDKMWPNHKTMAAGDVSTPSTSRPTPSTATPRATTSIITTMWPIVRQYDDDIKAWQNLEKCMAGGYEECAMERERRARLAARSESDIYRENVKEAMDKLQQAKKKANKEAMAARPMSDKRQQTILRQKRQREEDKAHQMEEEERQYEEDVRQMHRQRQAADEKRQLLQRRLAPPSSTTAARSSPL